MTRILIINGHPDPAPERFVHALLDAYAQGAGGAHEIRRLEIGSLDFPLIRSQAQWRDDPAPPAIAEAQDWLAWADHVVIAYPLWLGDMPALLKGFLEQVLRQNFAFREGAESGGWPQPRLSGKTARVIVTMGMPGSVYRLWFRAHSLKSLERNILRFVGFSHVSHSIIGLVEGRGEQRTKWLARMRRLGKKAG